VLFLPSKSPPKSASENPCKVRLLLLKDKYIFEVPFKYLNIHFTPSQCSFPGLDRNLLTTPTACAISGLVQIIAYIKLPSADAYGTLDM